MKSYTQLRTDYGNLTNNTTTTNLNFGSEKQNDCIRFVCSQSFAWSFLEESITETTVANQNNYDLPFNVDKIISITLTSGSIRYPIYEVKSKRTWDDLQYSSVTSDIPQYFFIYKDELLLYPTPATSNLTLTIYYKKRVRDLSKADYTTGTITVTNGDETVTGSGTTFTSAMVGRFLKTSDDNYWYEIGSVTNSTSLELVKKFRGVTAAGASYIIGEMPILPETYHALPLHYSVWQYWLQQKDANLANQYKQQYLEGIEQIKMEFTNKTTSLCLEEEVDTRQNPNLFVRL